MAVVHIIGLDEVMEIASRTMKSQPKDVGDPVSWWKCVRRTFKGTRYEDLVRAEPSEVRVVASDIRYKTACGGFAVVVDRKREMLTS